MTNERAREILFMQWQGFLEHNLDYAGISDAYKKAFEALELERKFLEAGYKNEEVEFYIGGRKFIVREVAQ